MSANEDFFRSKKAAAVLKHGILKRYPVVFAAKTGRGNPVVFLDGYAGPGEYRDGDPGSPLLLSQCADFVSGYRDVRGFFVEQDPENFANLSQVLAEKGGAARYELRQGSLDQHLPDLLALAKSASLFAFLDPFGPALDFNLIKTRLLGRGSWPPTEVLLHFSVSSVARMGSAVYAAEHKHGSLSDADRKVAERLDRFLGGSWWRQHFAKVTDQDDERRATDIALQVWQEYEKKLTANSRYRAVRMPVRPRPDLVPKYVLALFTTHSEGAWHFADSLGKAGVEWQQAWQEERWRRTGPDAPTLFDDALVFDARKYVADNAPGWIALIRQNLARLLDEGHPFKPADRVPDVYGSTLGQASATHVGSAIKEMHASGMVANTGTGDFWRTSLRRP
ncbi:three-Cys-motif partner protein TcmP [Micromonospora rubida]|uniref:three-Cys-motif partner protein TcmP n=1 Tax=Micromonospora rubida TaxID=2697657 RepID=UPI0013789A15|nr:three-Cys-motif partner protein TcmP [Micromonospora rubida]NBE80921.1 three-Cys-motif partner protein TcmP [Micromonospora rubida]